jgi:membrane-bound ClpP family serine protease
MTTRSIVALALLAALIHPESTALADQVVLKNGSVIEGQVTVDELRGKVHVKKKGGVTFSFSLNEVAKIVEEDAPSASPATPKDAPAPAGGQLEAVVIPLHGGFSQLRARDSFDAVLGKALAARPKLIVFEISSPGGAIAVGEHFARKILALECRTAAFVEGPVKGAYSAAAYVALSCDRIYMAPGQALGAAVAWQPSSEGAPKAVSAKFNSAWQASFRATAEANGYPTAIAQAMVSAEDGVAEVKTGGRRSFVAATRFYRKAEDGALARVKAPDGTTVRVLCKPGRVLTLTTQEARRVGICRGVAQDTPDFLSKLKIDAAQTRRLSDPLALARAFMKKEQGKLDKSVAAFNKRYKKLVEQAPGNHNDYELLPGGVFKDGGRAWRRRTKASLTHLKKALKQLAAIQAKLDRFPDLRKYRKSVAAYAVRLPAFEKELKSLRYIKRLAPR